MATIEITGANTLALGGFFSKWRDLPPHDQEPAPNMVDAGFARGLGQFLTDWEKKYSRCVFIATPRVIF